MSNEAQQEIQEDWSHLSGRLIVVSGASGSGKSTLLRHALARDIVQARLSVSATTRSPRPGEQHGREYYFISREEFEAAIADHQLLEWAEVHGNLYGTPSEPVREQLAAGLCVVLEIDVQGALQVRKRIKGTTLIFVNPPSFEVLETRLRLRSTENEATLARRLTNARWEMDQAYHYDHHLLNEDLDKAIDALVGLFVQMGCGGRIDHARRT